MKILLAEDETSFRNLMKEMLTKWGYEVIVALDGNEAWKALNNRDTPQIAILDWLMPGIDGLEICRKIRKELPEPYTYIILLTSQQRDEDIVIGMEAGADDYITKPIKVDELKVRLRAGRRIVELQDDLIAARETLKVHASDLEAANRDLEAFSYTVANDLLKSLMSIGDCANAIKEMVCDIKDEKCRSYAKKIYSKTKHLGELIGIMHDFFRPTRSEFHPETLDLGKMAGEMAEKLKQTNPWRQIKFRINEGIMVNGDKNLMSTVLKNLIDNAWSHTGKCEEGEIEFGVTEVEGKPAYFVRDNGIGFDMADAGKLFKPFLRLPGTDEFAKAGIGLATVERIIRRHGGRVWAEGEPGKGATFWFTVQQ